MVIFSAYPAISPSLSCIIASSDPHATSDSSDPPTIEWFERPENTTGLVFMYDGVYNGQTEEVWNYEIWVNDTNGVDTVIFRFTWEGEWINRSTTIIDGDEIRGLYAGNLTYSVEWNWTSGHPSPPRFGFSFKVFANNTLGNWVETTTVTYNGGYMLIYAPIEYILLGTPLGWAIIGGSISIVTVVVVLIFRRRA
jgi:hypothetical protein